MRISISSLLTPTDKQVVFLIKYLGYTEIEARLLNKYEASKLISQKIKEWKEPPKYIDEETEKYIAFDDSREWEFGFYDSDYDAPGPFGDCGW